MDTVELIKLSAEIATIIGVLVAIAGIIVAVWIFSKEMKKQTEVSQMTFFADYTKRYQVQLQLEQTRNYVEIFRRPG